MTDESDILSVIGKIGGIMYTLERDVDERDVEKYLVALSHEQKWECMKFIPDNQAGMPDRIILLPNGRCVWVELKTQGGRLSELQKYTHVKLRTLGQRVYVVWSKEQADNVIEEIKKGESSC